MAMAGRVGVAPQGADAADRVRAARLLQRLSFGPAPDEYPAALDAGVAATLARIMAGATAAGATGTDVPPPALPPVTVPGLAGTPVRAAQQSALIVWWLDRMTTSAQPLLERLTWFWHGHWATSNVKVRDAGLMLQQNETLRASAFGPFPTMARAMLRDPALLLWLDGFGNRRGHPNENLARECMELFTLGVGNYSEADVRAAARALTGWYLDPRTRTAAFDVRAFDPGPETILGATQAFDVDSLVDHIVAQPACPAFLSTRLWRNLVSDVGPTPTELADASAALTPTMDPTLLVAAIAHLLIEDPTPRPLAKAPVPWLIGVLRSLGLTVGSLPAGTQGAVLGDLAAMGQVPFLPPNVSGWPAGGLWFTAASTQARYRLSLALVAAADLAWLASVPASSRAAAVADRLGVPAWTPATATALAGAARSPHDLLVIALNAPEYLVGV